MTSNKLDFLKSISEEEFKSGCLRFNIVDEDSNVEGVWGWFSEEDRAKYLDDAYFGKATTILVNDPLLYSNYLRYGDEVVIRCNGSNKGELDLEWFSANH